MFKKANILKGLPWAIVAAFAIIAALFMFNASRGDSATMDELAHIPSGYSYVRFLDYRLNPEHPPLLKVLSGLPLLFLKLNFPTQSAAWTTDINGQWNAGHLFLYESGNDADQIVFWSRIGPIFITLFLIFLSYLWARKLLGNWWGLLPSFLLAFSPTVLAHGHYVTTDISAAFGALIAIWSFVNYLESPSLKRIVIAGACLGIAQLLKFSSVLLFPLLIFIALIMFFRRGKMRWQGNGFFNCALTWIKSLFSSLVSVFAVVAVAFVVIYAVYFIFTLHYPVERQVADTKATLQSFAGGPDENMETCKLGSNFTLLRRTRCLAEVDIRMAGNNALRPFGQYFLGALMVTQRATGGNTGYFMNEVSAGGWASYFPTLFFTKETLPALIFIGIGIIFGLIRLSKRFSFNPIRLVKKLFSGIAEYADANPAEFAMISYVVLYWAYSLKSPLNIGIRHILPTIPFVYILAAGSWKKFGAVMNIGYYGFVKQAAGVLFGTIKKTAIFAGVSFIIVWQMIECVGSYPYFLSYYNVFGGGINNGYRVATDSNYDWGQDLKRLKTFVEENNIAKIGVDYFGGGDPKYYLGDKEENWWSGRGNPEKIGSLIKWLAISVNTIQIAKGKTVHGLERDPKTEYSWLENPYIPYARAGKSIFIYKIGDEK